MTVYHQMGHDSRNLLTADHLERYRGAVLSPVNEAEDQARLLVDSHRAEDFEMVFDPQLYYPKSGRGNLPTWSYYPSDVDTADQSSFAWWKERIRGIAAVVRSFRPDAVCSPAVVPSAYSHDFYALHRRIANELADQLVDEGIDVLHTVLGRFEDLSVEGRSAEIASIVSGTDLARIYLVLIPNVHPRRELADTDALKGALQLIRYVEDAGIRVLVGYCSSDLVLWKAAGASDCATGKFFNLRRFTPSRFAPPPQGGGQVSYWFEESMVAQLRESDLIRIRDAGFLSDVSNSNPYGTQILHTMAEQPGKAWLGLGWRQYLYWFADFEKRLVEGTIQPDEILKSAETVWEDLEARNILMEESTNDGRWLRPWRRALAEAFANLTG